jgi:hypothetical protein
MQLSTVLLQKSALIAIIAHRQGCELLQQQTYAAGELYRSPASPCMHTHNMPLALVKQQTVYGCDIRRRTTDRIGSMP